MMTLPKDLEREFQQELKQYEEGKKMPYITSIERAGQLKRKRLFTNWLKTDRHDFAANDLDLFLGAETENQMSAGL